jgi:molecular chaperone HtpG
LWKSALDLNSSRTEIIMSEKWSDFEEALAFIIRSEIAKSVSADYWNEFKTILTEQTTNRYF